LADRKNLGHWSKSLPRALGYFGFFDQGERLGCEGQKRKFLRGRAVVFHLNHPAAARA